MPEKNAQEYAKALVEGYDKWFWEQGHFFERRLTKFFWLGITFSFFATIVAALPKSVLSYFPEKLHDLHGWLVVVLTTLATLFNATLIPKYKSLLELRETGRIRLDEIKQMHEINEYKDEERVMLEDLIKKIAAIETDFGGSERASGEVSK